MIPVTYTDLDLMEILLSAEILNIHENLDKNDIPASFRAFFGERGSAEIQRPVTVSEGLLKRELGIEDAYDLVRSNPFVEFEEFGNRLSITALVPAANWFLKKAGVEHAATNPALAMYYEHQGVEGFSYETSRQKIPLFEDTKESMDMKVAAVVGKDEELQYARDLIIISAPEEIEFSLETQVCTPQQKGMILKIRTAFKNREFLKSHQIYEFGKLLFVGPPGTGKTTLALSLSHELHMPVLEVRLAMLTSQYLGETSKNIDRIFDLARRLSPCILFIDEFDYVARSRMSDDNAAMKRAVNMLLKNIDTVSFVKNGVLLIGATNHPQMLDEAAWRRFDEVVEFPLPDRDMRKKILLKVTASIESTCDYDALADRTEGFTGADLRIMIKEAIITALMDNRYEITDDDIERGMQTASKRDVIRRGNE